MTFAQDLESLLNLPQLELPRISRDGRWAAWTWYHTGPSADVYVAPTDGSRPPLRLTETPHDSLVIAWTPDSRSLLVAQDHDGNERYQLLQVDVRRHDAHRPAVMQPLTEPKPNFYLVGGQLHPNGRWLFYRANLDASTGQEIEPAWLYRHDLETGERVPLARPTRPCYCEPRLNDPGTHILYQRNDPHPAGLQVWVVDVEGREDREILNMGPEKKAHASWFPDGQRALILAETETHQRVGVWELDTGELRWLLDDASRNIEAAYVPYQWTERPRPYSNASAGRASTAVIVESRQARTQTSLLDVATGEETPLARIQGTLVPLAPVGGGAWVGRYYSSQQPTDLVKFSIASERGAVSSPPELQPNAFVSLTRVWDRTPLTPADLAPAEDFRWQSVDGLEIQGWLYRARASDRQAEARGTIIHIHGGPTWHIEDWINPQVQYLAWQGFHVLQPNYRGSTGFSLAYREAIKQDGWGGREQDDIQTGIEALIAAGIAQPGKIGVTGTSYGGYSSWIAITRFPPELVVAAAPICGMTDLVIDWETTRPHLRPYSEEMMGGSPSQVPEIYQERSPRNHIENIRGQLLIVQGLQDPNVTPENVRVVRAALDQAGVDYEVLAFEDEGHGIHRPKNQRVLYRRLAEFFAQAFAGQ